jgi:Ni/Co efflux regulator RcnB
MGRITGAAAAVALLLAAGAADAGDHRGRDRGDRWSRGGPPPHAQAWRGDDRRWSRGWDREWDRAQAPRWRDDRPAPRDLYGQGFRDGYRSALRQDGGLARWRRGERLPAVRYVVIDDWRRFGLPEPRRGERYVRIDRDLLLVSPSRGVILDVLGP